MIAATSATPVRLASAAAIGGEAIVKCLIKNNIKGGSIMFPNTVPVGNIEVDNRVTAAFRRRSRLSRPPTA